MTRWIAAVLCALLLAPGLLACRSNDAPAADDPISESADTGSSEENAAEAPADADAEGDEDEASAPDAAAEAGAEDAGDEGEPLEQPTPDPTVVALAQSFEPPIKGDPNAPVMIYEFSDFL